MSAQPGSNEVAVATREGWLFAWRTRGPACDTSGRVQAEWRTFHHDEHRTGLLGYDSLSPARARQLRLIDGGSALEWSAPGGDGVCGRAARYDVRYTTDDAVDLTKLPAYVAKVSEVCNVPTPVNYPVVGKDAFETATGVHAAAVIKAFRKGDDWLANRVYSGVPADVFGLEQKITIGPMSGRSNVTFWLEKRGIEPTDELVDKIFDAAKSSHRIFTDAEVHALIGQPVG